MTRKMSKSFIFICFLVSILHCRGEPESSKTPALRRRLGFTDPRTITMRPVNAEQFNKNPAQLEDSSSLFSLSTQQQQVSATSVLSPMQQQQAQVSQSTQQQVSAPSLSSSSMLQQAQINQSEQQKAPEHNTLSDGSTENTPRKKLEFIHITKTGGSAIEAVAAKEGTIWGACHYKEVPNVGCNNPDWTKPKKRRFDLMPTGVRYIGEPWHAPAQWLNPNNMEDTDTFVVIRDPYDRIISEYYCSSFGYKEENPEDPKVFNTWLGEQLEVIRIAQKVPGHMLPQRYFVYDQNGDRVVSHILRYETLKHDFDALMEYYDLPMRMPDKTAETVNYVESINESTKRMTRNDISPENLKQINQIYANDFQYFDYPMMQTNRT
mmetsp:Transcript_32129/g.47464  ORF Transcript_32129/g.47464 Transcript_32129/m.47464 type:complete len:378 (+) Transcript_32129:140-1273(+)